MTKPIAKLRADVIKAAMAYYSYSYIQDPMSQSKWERFKRDRARFLKACAALAERSE